MNVLLDCLAHRTQARSELPKFAADGNPAIESPMTLPATAAVIQKNAKLIRFVVSGGGCAFLFFLLYYAGVTLGLRPFAANLGAYAIAFSVGYLLQRNWTFGGRHRHQTALLRYAIVQTGCALLTSGVTEIATPHLQVPKLVASLIATVIAGGASYVASLLWVFPDGDAKPPV